MSWGWTADGTPSTKGLGDLLEFNGISSNVFACVKGVLITGADAGTLIFQWAPKNSHVDDCILRDETVMILTKVS